MLYSNYFAPEFIDFILQSVSANFEDAIEHAEMRRAQSPVLYNEVRILEGPFPNLELSANDETDPLSGVKEEEIVIEMNADDRNELNDLLSTSVDSAQSIDDGRMNDIVENSAENEQHDHMASTDDSLSGETSSSSENAGDSIHGLRVENELSVKSIAATPPNENLELVVVRNELVAADSPNDDLETAATPPNENLEVVAVRNELVAAGSPNDDLETADDENEIEFIGAAVEMPKPMQSLRNGMVKFENDDLSGSLCYKITV